MNAKEFAVRLGQHLALGFVLLFLAAGVTSVMAAVFGIGAGFGMIVVSVTGTTTPSYIPIAMGSALTGFVVATSAYLLAESE